MQCISVQDDQPTQRLLLKANSCNVHCSNMLMTENGTEKLDNELITTLFEKTTTLAQLHQFTRAEEKKATTPVHVPKKKNKGQATYPEETSHNSIGYGIQVSTSNTHP